MTQGATCRACGTADVAAAYRVAEMMYGDGRWFDYDECLGCGSLTRRSDVEAAALYPDDYYSLADDPERTMGGAVASRAVRAVVRSALLGSGRLAGLAREHAPRREARTLAAMVLGLRRAGISWTDRTNVLDVGCGSGSLIYALGIGTPAQCLGVDPYAAPRTWSTGGGVLRCEIGDVEPGSWDLVMLHHSLEHVEHPVSTLGAARRALRSGGRVVLRMPTCSSAAWRRYGTSWVQLDAPRHTCVMSRRGVEHAVAAAGLVVQDSFDDSTEFQFWGSEQVLRGTPLASPDSLLDRSTSPLFTRRELADWARQARELNAGGDGDQAVWILRRPEESGTT